jgi:hypothetical protein
MVNDITSELKREEAKRALGDEDEEEDLDNLDLSDLGL